jgi:hypothetical protein
MTELKQDKQKKKSILPVLLASLALGALVIFIVYKISGPQASFKSVRFEGSSVYYSAGVGAKKAKEIGEFMKTAGIFKSDHGIDVRVNKIGGVYTVSFVTGQDEKYMDMMKLLFLELLKMMRSGVFAGEEVKLYLCRSNYTECVSVEPGGPQE